MMDEQINVIAKIGVTPYLTQIEYRNGKFSSDEPSSSGGQDMGPSPKEILAGSLASCTAITLRMYINRKQWIIDEITVDVKISNVNGKTLFSCALSFLGELDETKRERLLQIAKVCPVHKILTQPIEIITQIA